MGTIITRDEVRATWVPPLVHGFKVNVDEAVFKGQQTAGVGVLI